MIQAVAEGGMEEMEDQRVEARFGGSINGRAQYGLGSIFKGAAKAVSSVVSGVTDAVKSVVKSDLGKAALAAAAIYAAGGGSFFDYTPFKGATPGFAFSNLPGASFLPKVFGTPVDDLGYSGVKGFLPSLFSGDFAGAGRLAMEGVRNVGIGNLISGATGFLVGKGVSGPPKREDFGSDEEYEAAVARYRAQFQTAINNPNPQFAPGLFPNNPFYPQRAANGGRIGYQMGGIGDLIKQVTQQEFFGRPTMAIGEEIPVRQNQAGVQELDYRETGGFVPPIGIKEKADDIPAMLSNNEFVFTADAVRNAGGGNVNKGAQRMYSLMKNLESGGVV
jgi:hypothetical protein